MPSSAQADDIVVQARIDCVAGDHVDTTLLNRCVGRTRFCGNGNSLSVGGDDPLSSFFMESPFFVVCRGRVARADRGRYGSLDVARYLSGKPLWGFPILLLLRLVDQDMV